MFFIYFIQGKVKSIYENMKILQDPTPRFDSHIAKNASKVTSLSCYRAFDLTQVTSTHRSSVLRLFRSSRCINDCLS